MVRPPEFCKLSSVQRLTSIAAMSNEIASRKFLQFYVINFCMKHNTSCGSLQLIHRKIYCRSTKLDDAPPLSS